MDEIRIKSKYLRITPFSDIEIIIVSLTSFSGVDLPLVGLSYVGIYGFAAFMGNCGPLFALFCTARYTRKGCGLMDCTLWNPGRVPQDTL